VLREKEIVAVDQYGEVHRFDQRTTGDLRPEIEARFDGFAGIDRAGLLTVGDTKEVVQEAARAAWKDEQLIERDMARPLTGIETTIADALGNTMTGTEFAEALDKAGITITRATAADIPALDALRDEADLAATVAFTSDTDIGRDARHYDKIAEGDYAVVTGSGDVFRLNPTALDFEEAEQRLADVQPRLPSVVEARALSEQSREKSAAFWAEMREWNAEAGAERNAAFEGDRALHDTVNAGERGVENTLHAAGDAVNVGLHAAFNGFMAKAVEKVLAGVFSLFGGGEPKLTPMQMHDRARADTNEETLHARAYAAAEQEKEAATDARIFELVRQQQQDKHREDMGLSDAPAAQRKARDDYDGGYERER
jgi:hypothetical protein